MNQLHWITAEQFLDALAIGQVTPGPVIMLAAFVGYKVAGIAGAVVAASAIFLPSFLLMLSILPMLDRVRALAWTRAAMRGISPAVVGAVALTVVQLTPHAVTDVFTGTLRLSIASFMEAARAWALSGGLLGILARSRFAMRLRDFVEAIMRYTLKPLHCRPWLLQGLSPKLIESHYENNYGGALRRLNATAQLEGADFGKMPGFTLNGLKREELIAHNSVIFTSSISPASEAMGATPASPKCLSATSARWTVGGPSLRRWGARWAGIRLGAADLCAPRGAARQSVCVGHSHVRQAEFRSWRSTCTSMPTTSTSARMPAPTSIPSAQHRLEGRRRALPERIEGRAAPDLVQKEFGDLPGLTVEEVKGMIDAGQRVQFIDARPKHYVARTQDIIDGAAWRDPERVKEWAGELSKTDPWSCSVYGFHIGCQTAGALREAGFDAKYMKGGHAAWKAIGGPVKFFP